jgi:putative transposase
MCRLLGVKRSGYYRYARFMRLKKTDTEHEDLIDLIKEIAEGSRYSYGSRRMRTALNVCGYPFGRSKTRRLMKEAEVYARYRKKYKVTTNSNHKLPVFENILNRGFEVEAPDTVYASDITYIHTQEGWLYLAVVIDLYSRKVVGWSMGSRMKAKLVCDALTMAIWRRRPAPGLIHHSDQGSQYASVDFRRLLRANGITGSMSRRGNCWDNAVVESFFGSLKQEVVQWSSYQTRLQAQQDILNYITMFYNSHRLHSTLGYRSPNLYEREMKELQKVA